MPEKPDVKEAGSIVQMLINIVREVGKSGVAVVIFAFPPLMGCFGLYFMWMALNDSQVSAAKISAGIFATVFGSGLSILLLYVFSRMELWDILGLSKVQRLGTLTKLDDRVKALETLDSRVRLLEDKVAAKTASPAVA